MYPVDAKSQYVVVVYDNMGIFLNTLTEMAFEFEFYNDVELEVIRPRTITPTLSVFMLHDAQAVGYLQMLPDSRDGRLDTGVESQLFSQITWTPLPDMGFSDVMVEHIRVMLKPALST